MIVGIDLGTSNSLVAFINREGKAEIIINEQTVRLTFGSILQKRTGSYGRELARSQHTKG